LWIPTQYSNSNQYLKFEENCYSTIREVPHLTFNWSVFVAWNPSKVNFRFKLLLFLLLLFTIYKRFWIFWRIQHANDLAPFKASKALQKAEYSYFCIFVKFEIWNIPYFPYIRNISCQNQIFIFCKILIPTFGKM